MNNTIENKVVLLEEDYILENWQDTATDENQGIPVRFFIDDGAEVWLIPVKGNREPLRKTVCNYVDTDHLSMDGETWHFVDFAREMAKRNLLVFPDVLYIQELVWENPASHENGLPDLIKTKLFDVIKEEDLRDDTTYDDIMDLIGDWVAELCGETSMMFSVEGSDLTGIEWNEEAPVV